MQKQKQSLNFPYKLKTENFKIAHKKDSPTSIKKFFGLKSLKLPYKFHRTSTRKIERPAGALQSRKLRELRKLRTLNCSIFDRQFGLEMDVGR